MLCPSILLALIVVASWVLMVLKSEIRPSSPASFHNIQPPNIVVGLNSNQFHKFWWIVICRHPYSEKGENKHKTQQKHTKDFILCHTHNMGPFYRENRRTEPRHRHTQDGGPPGSVQDERRCERWHPGVGRTPGSPEPLLAPTGPIFGGKNDPILTRWFSNVSIFIDGGYRPIRTIKGGLPHPSHTHHQDVDLSSIPKAKRCLG